jgi:GH35 family endo-1,4-beta-xylanase
MNSKLSKGVVLVCFILISIFKMNAQIATGQSKFLGNVIGGNTPASFATYWNQVTPENAGKWESVEGTRGVFNWGSLDATYNYAKTQGYKFKQHTLVWGSQYPSWITTLSAADQKAEIIKWFAAVAQRYPNLDYVDVVNEPIKTSCPFKDALGGNGATGWDWVIESFRLARQYFPNAKLLINEYGTENDPNARAQYIGIINLLKAKGYLDGIGVQAHHFNLDYMNATQMKSCLDDYAATGFDVFISELDIMGTNGSTTEANQLAQYKELFPVIWNHPSVKGVTLWGYIEGQTWRAGTGIINSNGTERTAMTWLKSFVSGNTSAPTITANAGANGSISPTGTVSVASGTNKTFTMTANVGYQIDTVTVNGTSVGAVSTYTFNNVTTNQSISVAFKIIPTNASTITASAGANGTISPTGAVSVTNGTNKTFTMTPNAGYQINTVTVNGTSVGAIATYTFNNVTTNQSISATFKIIPVSTSTITATAGANGTLSPLGAVVVNNGTNRTFTITPNSNFQVEDVKVNGTSVGAVSTYTFNNVNANQTISATFKVAVVGGNCLLARFGVPRATALPDNNTSYSKVYTLGTGAPNLSNVTNAVINWSLPNNGLWQLSFNTNNGIPTWWLDMRNSVQNFAQAQPAITFAGTGIANLDGNKYYVNYVDTNNVVFVEVTGKHAIYFSNSATPPLGCGATAKLASQSSLNDLALDLEIAPNPATNFLKMKLPKALGIKQISVNDIVGKTISEKNTDPNQEEYTLDISSYAAGLYFVNFMSNETILTRKVIKE